MTNIMKEIAAATTLDEMEARLSSHLGTGRPIPTAAVRRALTDERYAGYLIACRESPDMLEMLLADPANAPFERQEALVEHSNPELIGKAAAALIRWGASGFSKVDAATFERRFDACRHCPNLVDPPDRLIYKISLGSDADRRVCSACGCVAARKARLPGESCPVADPEHPTLTRWGEPVPEGSGAAAR